MRMREAHDLSKMPPTRRDPQRRRHGGFREHVREYLASQPIVEIRAPSAWS